MTTPLTSTQLQRHAFRAMGTDIELVLETDECVDDVFARAEHEVRSLERVMSRFDADSQLSHLNARGHAVVGEVLFDVISLALDARRVTAGRFDPTMGEAIVAAGYDRTFDALPACVELGDDPRPAGYGVQLDASTRMVTLANGAAIDLGGIGKGYTADRLAGQLAAHGPGIANIGGDLRVFAAADGHSREWPIGVSVPDGEAKALSLRVGAIATSGRDRRVWRSAHRELHHVIDPETGTSADTDLVRVTVIAATAVEAEVRATELLVAGASAARAIAHEQHLTAILVSRSTTEWIGGFHA